VTTLSTPDATSQTASMPEAPYLREEPSFEDFYARLWPRLVTALLPLARDRALAEDFASEALIRACSNWSRVGAMHSPEAWTYRVGLNLARRSFRRRVVEMRCIVDKQRLSRDVDALPELELWMAVQQLPRRYRQAVALRYLGRLSEHEVAEALGLSDGGASSLLSAGRRRLRAILETKEEQSS
jgi:RNA polymerase sigma factor (sigma-70 family)